MVTAADDVLDFLPLFPNEDEETILARMRADANEGLDPEQDADRWVDTREGSHWYVSVMPQVREFARLYDLAGSEVPASGFPVWAWSDYLDDHAEVQDIERLAATRAAGEATFRGPAATVIAAGTVVGVEPVEPDAEVPEYEVVTGGAIGPYDPTADPLTAAIVFEAEAYLGNSPAASVQADAAASGGSALREMSVDWPVGNSNSVAVLAGDAAVPVEEGEYATYALARVLNEDALGVVRVGMWEDATATDSQVGGGVFVTATEYEWVYLGQVTRMPGDPMVYAKAWEAGGGGIHVDQVAFVAAGGPQPPLVTLPIRARDAGEAGNVGPGAVTVPVTPLPAGVEVTNAAPIEGGTEPETDDALRERVLGAYTGQGAGNRRDYERWARAWAGVGRVTVIPLWDGPGTVKVIVSTASGDPVSPETVAALQADLDPTPGLGDGQAPVGAQVTVETAAARPIDIEATVEFASGFSLDGIGGTIAKRADITLALREYVERVQSGGEVVVAQVGGRIAMVAGLHDVRVDSLEGVAPPVNVAIGVDPAEAPQLGAVTLTEGAL